MISALLGDPDGDGHGIVELLPPGARMPPGARTRANVLLEPMPGGAGDPDVVHGRRLFAAPERFESRPFSAAEAARTVTDVAVETLRARGEPARFERLLGEVLVGMDRAGQLRRLAGDAPEDDATTDRRRADDRIRRPGRPTAWAGPGPAVPVPAASACARDDRPRPRPVPVGRQRWHR